jgi:hypothetical protein
MTKDGPSQDDAAPTMDLSNVLGVEPGWWAAETLLQQAALQGLAEAWHLLGIVLAGAGKTRRALEAFSNAYHAGVKQAAASATALSVRTGRYQQVEEWSSRAFPEPWVWEESEPLG